MKKGFTLTEILIAIIIIGVITVLVLPNIVSNYKNKAFVSQLQSVDAAFKQAIKQAMIDERVTSLEDTIYASSAESFLSKYFKVTSDCGTSHSKCLASSYKSLDRTDSINTSSMLSNSFYCVGISTGAVICSTPLDDKYDEDIPLRSLVVVDVNGQEGPNINGRDLFNFEVYSDGKIGNQYKLRSNDANGSSCENNKSSAGYGGSCYSKIVADGWSMDY